MKPRNKFQKYLVEIDKKLPEITPTQTEWAYKNCLVHKGVRLKNGRITCLDCGHSWQSAFTLEWHDSISSTKCQNCGIKLEIETTRSRVFNDSDYMTILTTLKGFQVIRKFYISARFKSGRKPYKYIREVSRIYISDTGKHGIIGYSYRQSYYGERWFGSFDLKENRTIGNHAFVTNYVYPRKSILPKIVQHGFLGDTHTLPHYHIFYAILTNPKSETLLKAGQFKLFSHTIFLRNFENIEKHWKSIKICMRQKYIVKNETDWLDYLDLLEYFNKDLLNSKYVCPKDLSREHDRYVEKKRKVLLKQKIKEMQASLSRDQKQYKKEKKKYFGLSFENGKVKVKVISDVKKLCEYGDLFHHCIYTNEYYKKKRSLLLIATSEDKPLETVEFDLEQLQVIQSRGLQNNSTEYHSEIVNLVNSNAKAINKIIKSA